MVRCRAKCRRYCGVCHESSAVWYAGASAHRTCRREALRKERESIFKAAGVSRPFLSPLGGYGLPSSSPTSAVFSVAAPDSASTQPTFVSFTGQSGSWVCVVRGSGSAAVKSETQKSPLAQAVDRLHDSILRTAIRSAARRRVFCIRLLLAGLFHSMVSRRRKEKQASAQTPG